ncbi:hypothetical protein AB4238_00400 [Shewanella sp. 10N.286.45.A1]|uniref:hypothetical protein n=1 Tax=Shewanella sp. 10N.286.45.A1 TaxID=3229694 RepID=UPI00354CE820
MKQPLVSSQLSKKKPLGQFLMSFQRVLQWRWCSGDIGHLPKWWRWTGSRGALTPS